jgi:Peptidase C13 family
MSGIARDRNFGQHARRDREQGRDMKTGAGFARLAVILSAMAPLPAVAGPFDSWAAIVVAGDYRASTGAPSEVFDNGRRDLVKALTGIGFSLSNILQFTSKPMGDAATGARQAETEAIFSSFTRLARQTSGGCLLYYTSHGTPQGILIGTQMMTPRAFAQLVDAACSDKLTVAVISACYSGVFLPALRAETRMIFTAARQDRTSFGCGEANQYTFFDQCVLESLKQSSDLPALAYRSQDCVAAREKLEGATPPSEPQLYIGTSIGTALQQYAFPPG